MGYYQTKTLSWARINQKNITIISFFICFLWFANAKIGHAQPASVQTLIKNYQDSKADTTKCRYVKAVANYYLNISMRDSAAHYFEKALLIFERKGLHPETFNCLEELAVTYLDLGEYNKATEVRIKKLELAQKLKLPASVAQAYHDLGYLYFFMGEYYLSLENYFKAMDIFKAEKLDFEYNVTRYYCALLYFEIGDYENSELLLQNALVFFKKYEAPHKTENKPSYAATIYKRLALVDIEKQNYKRGLTYCDSAFTLLKDGPSIGWVYAHRGVIYTKMDNFAKAKENFDLSREFVPQCDHCYWPIYTDMSEYFLHFGMVDSAIYYCNKTLERAITYRYDIRILRTYKVMAKAYETKGDYAKAYGFSEKYSNLYQAALNKRKLAMIKNAEHKKASERIEDLEGQNQQYSYNVARQRLVIFFSLAMAAILAILFFIVFKNQKQKQRLLEDAKKLEVIKSRIAGQEEERSRITRELHDGIAANLTGVRINLNNLTFNPNEKYPITDIINQITSISNEVRAISHNLASPVFDNTSLEDVIKSYIVQFTGKKELDIKLNVYPKIDWSKIDYIIQQELYRIFQEIVNNTIKHSNATGLMVQIVKHDSYLSLTFEDNGKGFTETDASGIGLTNIKKRIQIIDGEIEISGEKNRGCSISIEVPLRLKPKYSLS